jgi:hypothetical protein
MSCGLSNRQLFERGERLYDETYSRYHGLGKLLESENPREKFKAAMTLNMLEANYGEAVVQANLGALTPRVLDVVRIFYPNQILNMLADVQPLDGVVGSIFLMKPRFIGCYIVTVSDRTLSYGRPVCV